MHTLDTAANQQQQAFRAVRRALRLNRNRDIYPAAILLRDAITAAAADYTGQHYADTTRLYVDMAFEQSGRTMEQAHALVPSLMRGLFPTDTEETTETEADPGERVRIQIEPGDLTREVNEAEAALIAAGAGLYQRGGLLVRIGWVEDGASEAMRVVPVDETHLLELIGRVTRWIKRDARAKGYVATSCPREVAAAYMARGGLEWRVPRLAGVIGAPTLRANGSILNVPGHDADTGLFLALDDSEAGCNPRPTFDDAEWAADELNGLLAEFPFVAESDHAVALAAILTAVIRPSLPTAPLFAFTAPTPGTGKSLLVDLVSLIATGRKAPGFTWSDDQHENRKALDAALLEGAPAISLDNVTAPLCGDRLNQVLTQTSATVRVLGQSKTVEVACNAFIMANGNNLAVAADLTRRTMLCRLDAKVERPEHRAFKSDPLAAVQADRGRYLSAALTILRAYHCAGRPDQPKALGSFDAWSGWVRGAVMWLGYADPVASQESVREVDPRGAELAAVLGQWNETLGDRRATSAQVIAAAAQSVEFRESLLAVAGVAGAINTRRLGMWLNAHKGRVCDGLRIEAVGKTRDGVGLWAISGGRCVSDIRPFPMAGLLEAAS